MNTRVNKTFTNLLYNFANCLFNQKSLYVRDMNTYYKYILLVKHTVVRTPYNILDYVTITIRYILLYSKDRVVLGTDYPFKLGELNADLVETAEDFTPPTQVLLLIFTVFHWY